nr:hypothetical protein [Cytophagales bacterium]
MMKVTLMYNLKAGNGSFDLEKAVTSLEELGIKVAAYNTKEKGYKKGIKKPCDLMVIAGGDGTVEKLFRKIVKKQIDILIGILPCGTANNLATNLKLEGDIARIISCWKSGQITKLSVGEFSCGDLKRHFVESVGWGVFSDLIRNKSESKKLSKGKNKMARGTKKLKQLINRGLPFHVNLILDGQVLSGRYLWVEIMNSARMGPGLTLAPSAALDDRSLAVFRVEYGEKEALKEFLEMSEKDPVVSSWSTLKAKEIWVGCTSPPHIDDELFTELPFAGSLVWAKVSLASSWIRIIDTSIHG